MSSDISKYLPKNRHFDRCDSSMAPLGADSSYFVDCDISGDVGVQLSRHAIDMAIPILSHPGPWAEGISLDTSLFVKALKICQHAGFPLVVLGADNDSLVHQALSPRSGAIQFDQRLAYLESVVVHFTQYYSSWGVALTIEELCPAGTDATDGIIIAQALEKWGASFIIGSGGTRDFPALKWRRRPQIKHDPDRFVSPESWLASAQWLVPQLSIPILAGDSAENIDEALVLSHTLGLWGLVLLTHRSR